MHASLKIGDATVMASDGGAGEHELQRIFVVVRGAGRGRRDARVRRLADGGQVQMPLGKTFWSPCFGMLTDRFGVGWMVGVFP